MRKKWTYTHLCQLETELPLFELHQFMQDEALLHSVQTLAMGLCVSARWTLWMRTKLLLSEKFQQAAILEFIISKVYTPLPLHFCCPLLHLIVLQTYLLPQIQFWCEMVNNFPENTPNTTSREPQHLYICLSLMAIFATK